MCDKINGINKKKRDCMDDKTVITLCAVFSLLVFAAGVVLTVLNRRNAKNILRIAAACVFLMMVSMLYPYYAIQKNSYAIGFTLVQSMCAMLLNSNPEEILSGFNAYNVSFLGVYKGVLLILLIIAPLFTVGITLSFFSGKFAKVIYRIRSTFKDSYLFSAINERTLCIAEDIARTHKKAVIVFALHVDVNDVDAQFLARIKQINATIINEDIVEMEHSLDRKRNYYLLSTDGGENLERGLRMYQKYNGQTAKNVNMWIYSKDEIAEIIFDHLYETFNVRLINEEGLIAKRLLNEYPLFNAIKDGRLSVLMVGGGHIGLEILRLVTTCACFTEDVKLEINVVDADGEQSRKTFEKTSPLLAERWGVRFHTANVKQSSFTELLKTIDPTYIVVALGDQTLDMETAVYVRRFYGLKDGFPRLHALVDHKSIEMYILPNLCVTDWQYDKQAKRYKSNFICSFEINTFGSYEDTYSDLRISASYQDCLAVAVNAQYRGIRMVDEDNPPELLVALYNQVTYYKEFSDSYALTVPYKLFMMGMELVDDNMGDLTYLDENLERFHDMLRLNENRRFESFMRGHGWTQMLPSEVTDRTMGDKLRKRNARVENTYMKELSELTGRDLEAEDRASVMNLPIILRLANELYGRKYSVRKAKGDEE